jgi:Proteasome-substrate-size regulator, mid region
LVKFKFYSLSVVYSSSRNETTVVNLLFQLYLTKMLLAIESYYYPANDTSASEGLHSFVAVLCTYFVQRVHLERYNKKWKSKTPGKRQYSLDTGSAKVNGGLSQVFSFKLGCLFIL